MNASLVRMKKEARALFWPWCAVMAAGALPLFWDPSESVLPGMKIFEAVAPAGFFLGIPLLAVLSFGDEFQHRTLSVVLSQPVSRMKIWREKLVATAFAVLSATMVFYFSGRLVLNQEQLVIAGLYVLTTTTAATFWTLVARSTIGGLVLGWLPLGGLELGGAILDTFFSGTVYETAGRLLDGRVPPQEARAILSSLTLAALVYAGLMLWLGARKLARFQATGGLPGGELFMASSKVLPDALAGWFRQRPAEPDFNLIRKELRLLQPVWVMGLLLFLYMTCLVVFGLLPHGEEPTRGQIPIRLALLFPLFAFTPVMAILAGCLSLGEERTSGTHSWHLTLPVSARRQWLIKLLVGVLTGFVCAALLPVLVFYVDRLLYGSPFRFRDAAVWMIATVVLSLVSYWCASAISGTVRAALWVFPLLGALLVAFLYGELAAPFLTDLLASRLDLFVDFGFTNALSNIQIYHRALTPVLFLLLMMTPPLLFAVRQSCRLFRVQHQESALFVIRALLPVALVAFLWSFSLGTFEAFRDYAKGQMWTFFRETHEAIAKVQQAAAKSESSDALQLKVEDLAQASPLSDRTRLWLKNSRITVAPDRPTSGHYCCRANSKSIRLLPDRSYSWYLATIHRPGGSVCTVSFQAGRGFGILGGVCE